MCSITTLVVSLLCIDSIYKKKDEDDRDFAVCNSVLSNAITGYICGI